MASKELLDKLNSLSKEELISNYIDIDAELDRLEGIEIKCYKLEKALDKACRKYADMKDKYRIDYLKQGLTETHYCNWEKVKANILKELESEK